MATLKEQLATEQEKLRKAKDMLGAAKNAARIQGATTSPAIEKLNKEISRINKTISKLNADINKRSSEKAEASKTPKQVQDELAKQARESLPIPVNDKLWNEVKGLFPNISPEAFNVGGAGSAIFVYQGEKQGQAASPTGGTYKVKQDNAVLANEVVNSFWQDKAIQNKVLNAIIASGKRDATQLDAYATWQSVVQQAAQLYNAGKGPKFTPIDILNMQITKAGGVKPEVTTYIDVKKDAEIKETLKKGIFPYIQKEPKDDDPIFNKLFNDVKAAFAKGVTTTTTVNPKTGAKTVKQTGGMSDAEIDAKIKNAYRNTTDYLEAKSLEATDYFTQWMRG